MPLDLSSYPPDFLSRLSLFDLGMYLAGYSFLSCVFGYASLLIL